MSLASHSPDDANPAQPAEAVSAETPDNHDTPSPTFAGSSVGGDDASAGDSGRRGRRGRGGEGGGRDRGPSQNQAPREDSEWKEKVIQIRRVTKVVKGGKKLSFRAVVVVGNEDGQVGLGIGKSSEVIGAIQKGVSEAKKNLIQVPRHKETIPHAVSVKAGGSKVVLRPASQGTGIIAGGAARPVLELAGVHNILCKSLGASSPLNVARATLKGLEELRTFSDIAANRGLSVKQMLFAQ